MLLKLVSLIAFVIAWKCVAQSTFKRIHDAEEMVEFAREVNYHDDYFGVTVLLSSDIVFTEELSRQFEPINFFRGTFNGQGYLISNLVINTTSRRTGLFTFSDGRLKARNVAIDGTCSITSSYASTRFGGVRVGGIIGDCYINNDPLTIENSVNMAPVSFNGHIDGSIYTLYMGGIVADVFSLGYGSVIQNCVNYGPVTHNGRANHVVMGGIVARTYSYSPALRSHIRNCLNYGALSVRSAARPATLYVGGIAGYSRYTSIENNVNCGHLAVGDSGDSKSTQVGSIVGSLNGNYSLLSRCYWSEDVGFAAYGGMFERDSVLLVATALEFDGDDFELNETVSIEGQAETTSLVEALNFGDTYTVHINREHNFSTWVLNRGRGTILFSINGKQSSFRLDSQVVLLPILPNEGTLWFDGWYGDSECAEPFTEFEVDPDTTLYGRFGDSTRVVTISFDTGGGTRVDPIIGQIGFSVDLPSDPEKNGCSVAFWEDENRTRVPWNYVAPARNITLTAVWLCTFITTPEEFLDFSTLVNSGISCNGTTIILENDIDLGGKAFEPIGAMSPRGGGGGGGGGEPNFFLGTFNGQGHVISNLVVNSSAAHAGLFGYSSGLTLQDFVLDSSCSIGSVLTSARPTRVYVGGVIGLCFARDDGCTIKEVVNEASVTFGGSVAASFLYLGGIAGILGSSTNFTAVVSGCTNRGRVLQSGTCSYSHIGGILGFASDYMQQGKMVEIRGCINYGDVTHRGATNIQTHASGIAGYSHMCDIKDCENKGRVSVNGAASLSVALASFLFLLLFIR